MDHITFGRKVFSFGEDDTVLKSTSCTEKALPGEGETALLCWSLSFSNDIDNGLLTGSCYSEGWIWDYDGAY